MINYGKVALQKINEINRNSIKKTTETNTFIQKSYQYNLDSTNNYFVLNLEAKKQKVYFSLSLDSNVNCKVYINSILQFFKHDFNFATFGLFVDGNQTIKFEFETNVSQVCKVQVLGNVQLVEDNIILKSLNYNMFCAKQLETKFRYCSMGSLSQTINTFNEKRFYAINGRFLDINSTYNILIERDNKCYVIAPGGDEIDVGQLSDAVLLDYRSDKIYYVFSYIENGQLNFLMTNSNGEEIAKTMNLSLGNNIKISQIYKVVNNVDEFSYLACVDANLNVYIVLCKFDENGLVWELSKPISVGCGTFESAIKVTSNNYMFATKNNNEIKIVDVNIDFETSISSQEFSRTIYNSDGVCLIDADNIVLRYDDSLINVGLNW